MTKEEVLQHDKKFRYMLLSRMQSDCEYYLNYGNRNPKRLVPNAVRLRVLSELWQQESKTPVGWR